MVDFYRGRISARKLGVFIRYLPRESALVTAMNDDEPMWSRTDHLLADLWAVLVKAHSDGKAADDLDHPARAALAAKAIAAAKQKLKAIFLQRKRELSQERSS